MGINRAVNRCDGNIEEEHLLRLQGLETFPGGDDVLAEF